MNNNYQNNIINDNQTQNNQNNNKNTATNLNNNLNFTTKNIKSYAKTSSALNLTGEESILPLDKNVDEEMNKAKNNIEKQNDTEKVVKNEKVTASDKPQAKPFPTHNSGIKIKNSNFPNTNPLNN